MRTTFVSAGFLGRDYIPGSMFRTTFGRTLAELYGPAVLRQAQLCRPTCRAPWPHGARMPTFTLFKPQQTYMNNSLPALSIFHHVRLFSTPARYLQYQTRDTKREEEARHETLKVDPQSVSTTGTVTPIFGSSSKTNKSAHETDDVDMLAGLISDLVS